MKNVSKKIVSVLSAVAMMSTLFVSVQAEDAGSYNGFGAFSTYNEGASKWGRDPENAGAVTVTDIEGGKKVTLDNTIAKVQFNPTADNIPAGYEWYTVSGSIKTDNNLAFTQVPYIYEAGELANTNVVTIGYKSMDNGVVSYQFKSNSSEGVTTIFKGDFSNWVDFKYVVHNSQTQTTVYAFLNDNLIGIAKRATRANGIRSMIFETLNNANYSGSVYIKDVNYTWSNEAVSVPNCYSMDGMTMNGLESNVASYPTDASVTYDADNNAIAFYSNHIRPLVRFFEPTKMNPIPQDYDYYKTSFKAKRDASYGAGTVIIDITDHNAASACWFVIYRKRGWNQIQVKANTAEGNSVTLATMTSYKDEVDWTAFDIYLDRTTNTVNVYINDKEVVSLVPKATLLDLQRTQLAVSDLETSYSANDGVTGPLRYLVKDYTAAWGEHDLRYDWVEDDSIELVNANTLGVVIDAAIGSIPASSFDQISILNTKTGDNVPIKGSSTTGSNVYIDADLELDVEYAITIQGGITGVAGQYTGETYSKGFKIKKVYEQLGSDWETSMSCTKNTPSHIGDVYFIGASIPNNAVGTTKITNYTNFTQIYDVVPYRHYNNTKTWSNTVFYMDGGKNLSLEQNTNGESYGDVKVAGVSKGSATLKTPLGMECVEMGRDANNNPDGILKYFTDANGNQLPTPEEIKTHQEVYTVTNNAFRVYSDASGDMKLAYAYNDSADELSNRGYVQMQSSGRMLFGLKRVVTTVPELFDISNDEITDMALINASKDGVVLSSSIGTIFGKNGLSIKNAETGEEAQITGTSSAGKNVYVDAKLDTDVVYQVSVAKGTQGRNGYIAQPYTKYFKIKDVETVDTISGLKTKLQNSDEYGDFYYLINGWVNTDNQYENATVTFRAQRFGAYGYGTYSNESVKQLDGSHNYARIYHTVTSDGIFTFNKYTYDAAQNKYVVSAVENNINNDSSTKNGVFKTDNAATDSAYVPTTDANGCPVILTNSEPYVEKINFSGNVLSVSYNDNTPYTYIDEDGFFPAKGSFGFESSAKGIAKIYDYTVTVMETVEPTALEVNEVSANAKGINVKFSGNVDAVDDFSAITLSANGSAVDTDISAQASTLTIAPKAGVVSGAIYTLDIAAGFGNLFSATEADYSKTFRINVYAKSIADATITGASDALGDGVIFTGNLGIDSADMAEADAYTVEFNYTDYLALNDSVDFDEEWNYDTQVPQTSIYTTASSVTAAPVNGSYFMLTKAGVELWKNTSSNGSKIGDGATINTKYGDAYAGDEYTDLRGEADIAVIPANTDFEALGYDFYDGSEGLVNQTNHQATTYAMKVVKDGQTVTLYRDGVKVGELTDVEAGYFGIEASAFEFIGISDLMAYSIEDADGIIPTLDVASNKVVLANYGEAKSVVVVVTTYNNAGAMVDADVISVNAATGNTDVAYSVSTTGATKYGVMVWDALSTLNPLADKLTVLK